MLALNFLGDGLRDAADPYSQERGRWRTIGRARSPVLEVENLVTDFRPADGGSAAVDDVSFELRAGKTLCVVGESGSGKSVTARSILQIVDTPGRIVAGEVLLHRHRTSRGSGAEETIDLARLEPRGKAIRAIRGRDIAMIFQEPMSALSPVHTIGNQIAEVIRLHETVSKKEARARSRSSCCARSRSPIRSAADRYTFEYSGGMRQRAMIAMAIACNPSVLIADEPTTALDVTTQAEILDLIKRMQDEHGMAMMLITHDMGVVAEIADAIVVMRHGKLVERATSTRSSTRRSTPTPTTCSTRSSTSTARPSAPRAPPAPSSHRRARSSRSRAHQRVRPPQRLRAAKETSVAVRRRRPRPVPRRESRRGRRKRLRQDHARPLPAARPRSDRGQDALHRQGRRRQDVDVADRLRQHEPQRTAATSA